MWETARPIPNFEQPPPPSELYDDWQAMDMADTIEDQEGWPDSQRSGPIYATPDQFHSQLERELGAKGVKVASVWEALQIWRRNNLRRRD